MAHILKEGSNATLKQILNRYHSLILGVAFFMNFAAILFHVVSVESYSDAMRQALSLQGLPVRRPSASTWLKKWQRRQVQQRRQSGTVNVKALYARRR